MPCFAAETSCWAGGLGGTVDAEDDWHMLEVDGHARIGDQLAPNHVPPDWPDAAPQQIHLDLWVDHPATANDLVTSLGTTVLNEADDGYSLQTFHVYVYPAGHPSALC